MSELRDLYQEVILDHNRRPRNFGSIAEANRRAEGFNPLCGDRITLQLRVEDDTIIDIGFEGEGCAISIASASVMTESLKGKSVEEAKALFDDMVELLTGDPTEEALPSAEMGKLAAFAGVREYPARVKCASLAWHTLVAALRDEESVTTE